jgi:Rha family phage regulatory protein
MTRTMGTSAPASLDLFPETLLVQREGNHVFTTSLKVAEHFRKRHANVLRAVDRLECSERFRRLNFESASYLDRQKKPRQTWHISHDGFIMLAMGFTGTEAAYWREQFIERFNQMEAEVRRLRERYAHAFEVVRPYARPVVEGTEQGLSRTAIAQPLGKSTASISYHRRKAREYGLLPEGRA